MFAFSSVARSGTSKASGRLLRPRFYERRDLGLREARLRGTGV
jgi:hypothetical protein